MGKTRSLPQQPSPTAHRAASRLKQNSTFANKFNHVFNHSDQRGNLLGVFCPYWLRTKESEERLG